MSIASSSVTSSCSSAAPVACACRFRATAVAGGLLWFAATSLLAFGGPTVKSHFSDYGAALSTLTISTLRASEWLSGHAVVTAVALACIVVFTLIIAAISRRAKALGVLFLFSGIGAWTFLGVSLLWPAIELARATP